jgi:hypothetical protein
MLRNMVVSSTTAIVFGLTSASLGALTLGSAAIPFIIVSLLFDRLKKGNISRICIWSVFTLPTKYD